MVKGMVGQWVVMVMSVWPMVSDPKTGGPKNIGTNIVSKSETY